MDRSSTAPFLRESLVPASPAHCIFVVLAAAFTYEYAVEAFRIPNAYA